MWRIVVLGVLGLVLGSRAHSERGIVIKSLLFGLLYGGVEVLAIAAIVGWPSPGRVLLLLGLGLVIAAPVYAIAELWRRAFTRAREWLQRSRH